ncbi:B-cell receptor-associated protein 29 isoform X2 [Austrofundulus limnaeus]|uniref:Endoplasmic reticulum transmembrane protein n=1 Tax=Austrofundulus limnaeus TaxID=52670 RepID=A0A2I4BXV0_AUSLI|nr:PREDICTED: B-cell receptor-associated protein 29-like isoform X2 [Austrofundulus limnaeus]
MTLQWTTVAVFLYSEIAVNLILWRLVFNWRIWSWLSLYWNKCFFAIIMVLIVLFLDAIREVQKYSDADMQDANANPNLYDHVHMKLFRAQRNLYICGFSLFLWLVMRRVVTLLSQVAATLEDSAGLQAQGEQAFQAAEKQQEENEKLKKALLEGEKSTSATEQQLKLQIKNVTSQLRDAQEAVQKSHAEVEAMRRQAKGLAQEYDRLLREHHQLQNLHGAEDKKDQ